MSEVGVESGKGVKFKDLSIVLLFMVLVRYLINLFYRLFVKWEKDISNIYFGGFILRLKRLFIEIIM